MGRGMVQGKADFLGGCTANILRNGCPGMPEIVDADGGKSVESAVGLQRPVDVDVETVQVLMPLAEAEQEFIVGSVLFEKRKKALRSFDFEICTVLAELLGLLTMVT